MISQLLNFAFIKVISGINYILGFGVAIVFLEVGVIVGFKVSNRLDRFRRQEKMSEFSPENASSARYQRLKASYVHPWFSLRERIFDYYDERVANNRCGVGLPSRYQDLNVMDSPDFKVLRNLQSRSIDKMFRKSIKFMEQQAVGELNSKSCGGDLF
jgi:hypothetical protein